MGNCCHAQKIEVVKKIQGKDITYEAFQDSNGEIFDIIDRINPFYYFRLEEIAYLYSESYVKDDELVDGVSHDIFIEKKFLKNINLCEYTLNNQKEMTKMKDFASKMFDILFKAFKSYYKELKDEKYKEKNKIPNICFLPIAVLWGKARTDVKIDFIFNFLSNSTGDLVLNDKVKFFLFAYFAIPSCVSLFAYKILAEENEDYMKEISKFDFETIFQGYEVKDSVHCTGRIVEELFGGKEKLTYDEYRNVLNTNREVQSLLTPKGVRSFINKNDI